MPRERRPAGDAHAERRVGRRRRRRCPSAASAASASSRVVFSGLTRRSNGARRLPRARERRALVVAVDVAEPLPQPVGKVGGDGAAAAALCRRDLNARSHDVVGRGERARRDRAANGPSSRTSDRERELARVAASRASASSERMRRRYANTPSAMNARSRWPISGCARKNADSAASAGDVEARDARDRRRRARRAGSRARVIGRSSSGTSRRARRCGRCARAAARRDAASRARRGRPRRSRRRGSSRAAPRRVPRVGVGHAHLHRDVAQRRREPDVGVGLAVVAAAMPALGVDRRRAPTRSSRSPRA